MYTLYAFKFFSDNSFCKQFREIDWTELLEGLDRPFQRIKAVFKRQNRAKVSFETVKE